MVAVCFSHRVVNDTTLGLGATDIVIQILSRWKCEVKTAPLQAMKAYVGVELQIYLFLTSTLNGCEWSASRSSSITLGKAPLLPSEKR